MLYQTSRKLRLLWLSWTECHQHRLLWVTVFICSSLHCCTLLIIEVAIYSILGFLCYLSHTNSLSLCVLFYHEYEKGKTNLICRELMHMSCTNLEILYARSFLFQSHNWKCCQKYLPCTDLKISYMHGHFCFCHLTENIAISNNCHARIHKSYMHGHIRWHIFTVHKLTDLYEHVTTKVQGHKVIIIRSVTYLNIVYILKKKV